MICERCSDQGYATEKCTGCGKLVCGTCVKAAKRIKKIKRLVICRDCWGKLATRKKWKAA